MKAIQIKLYTFKELGRLAKQKALTTFRHLNVDFNWWEYEYEDFISLCGTLGTTVKKESIRFSGFYTQGDGSAFTAEVDFQKLFSAIRTEAWKAYAPLADFRFPQMNVDRRVLQLVESGILPADPQILARHRVMDLTTDLGIYVVNERRSHDLVFEELEKLDDWFAGLARILNGYLFKSLQAQYEFLTADSSVKENLLFNEYLFTADGRSANHLHQLAIHHNKTE